MTETLTVLLATAGAVAAMLAVLLPVVLLQGKSLRREINLKTDNLAADLASVRTDLAEVRNGARADLAAAVTDLRADLAANLASVRGDLAALAGRMDTLTARVDSVAERVARIEGALTGPWRPPANGNPAPAPSSTQTP